MVLLLVVSLVALVWMVAAAARLRAGVIPAKLGWMSEQWLVQYRASQSK
jgi:hypothetical protein